MEKLFGQINIFKTTHKNILISEKTTQEEQEDNKKKMTFNFNTKKQIIKQSEKTDDYDDIYSIIALYED